MKSTTVRLGYFGGVLSCILFVGCAEQAPIVTYEIPTAVPAALAAEDTRMVAAILPQEGQAWFFKIVGRKSAVDGVVDEFREFVEQIEFQDGEPVIGDLPENWKRGGERAMRFASIDINTPEQQLDLSISQLSRMDDWDALVTSNIVRWRKQVGLDATDQKWSGAEELEWKNADSSDPAVWLDVTGRPDGAASPPMGGAPFAGGGPFSGTAPFAGGGSMPSSGSPDPHAGLPRSAREAIAARTKAVASGESSDDSGESAESDRDAESKIQYDRPKGWRDGRMSMMRLAAFNVGPEDSAAEVTIINAGGDLRGNVARWMGQIRSSAVPDEDVDAAIENAEQLEVSGHSAQRFVLMPDDTEDADATAIDATIIPLEEGFSMFVKMTGPVETVKTQSEKMKAFLESIEF